MKKVRYMRHGKYLYHTENAENMERLEQRMRRIFLDNGLDGCLFNNELNDFFRQRIARIRRIFFDSRFFLPQITQIPQIFLPLSVVFSHRFFRITPIRAASDSLGNHPDGGFQQESHL